jgi:hypothetical protein
VVHLQKKFSGRGFFWAVNAFFWSTPSPDYSLLKIQLIDVSQILMFHVLLELILLELGHYLAINTLQL